MRRPSFFSPPILPRSNCSYLFPQRLQQILQVFKKTCILSSGNRLEVATTLVVAPKDPLGCILEAVFGECRHLGLLQELDLLQVHELLLVLYVSVICCQAHQVMYLKEERKMVRMMMVNLGNWEGSKNVFVYKTKKHYYHVLL